MIGLLFPAIPAFAVELEQTWLRTDQPWYLPGDDLHYAVYLFNPEAGHDAVPSRILVTELTNIKGDLIQRHFHKMTAKVSRGTYILPDTLATGCYWLRAFTQYQVGFAENLIHYVPVFVITPEDLSNDDKLRQKMSFNTGRGRQISAAYPVNTHSSGNISVQITGMKMQSIPGDKIDLKIEISGAETSQDAAFSLLVRNVDQFGSVLSWPGSLEKYGTLGGRAFEYRIGEDQLGLAGETVSHFQGVGKPVYAPQHELKLRGKLIDPATGEGLGSRAIALTQTGRNPDFELIFTDRDGYFEFSDLRFTNRNNRLVLNAGDREGIIIEDQVIRPVFSPPVLSGDLTGLEFFRQYVEKRRLERRFRKFYTEESPVITENNAEDGFENSRIYNKPDHIYRLDDYITLRDMREVIIEIMPNVKIYKENDLTRIRLYSHQNAGITPDPLFLVNGRIVKDSDYVLNMDNRNIRQIEVLVKKSSLEPFGPMGIGGVVAIYTRDPVPVPTGMILDVEGYHEPPPNRFVTSQSERIARNVPDFSPVIYWDPACSMGEDGSYKTSFLTNDLTGKFEILVEGMTAGGIPIVQIEQFIVGRPAHP